MGSYWTCITSQLVMLDHQKQNFQKHLSFLPKLGLTILTLPAIVLKDPALQPDHCPACTLSPAIPTVTPLLPHQHTPSI